MKEIVTKIQYKKKKLFLTLNVESSSATLVAASNLSDKQPCGHEQQCASSNPVTCSDSASDVVWSLTHHGMFTETYQKL